MTTRPVPETPEMLKTLLGATLTKANAYAKAARYITRLSNIDGKPCAGTPSYRFDRINLYLAEGKVISAFFG
jgi:hypothetical protein